MTYYMTILSGLSRVNTDLLHFLSKTEFNNGGAGETLKRFKGSKVSTKSEQGTDVSRKCPLSEPNV